MDESYDRHGKFLLIGALFVPQDASLNPPIHEIKERERYFARPERRDTWKEFSFKAAKHPRDIRVGKSMLDLFHDHDCWMRVIVIDWSIFDPSYFGNPFEDDSVRERKAYKKWAELLLQPELRERPGGDLFMDRLARINGYDVASHLWDRFVSDPETEGRQPRLARLQMVRSHSDEHQGLQLCDLLIGSVTHALVPGSGGNICKRKCEVTDYALERLRPLGVESFEPRFWRQYSKTTLREHQSKFSLWYWQPDEQLARERRKKKLRRGRRRS